MKEKSAPRRVGAEHVLSQRRRDAKDAQKFFLMYLCNYLILAKKEDVILFLFEKNKKFSFFLCVIFASLREIFL